MENAWGRARAKRRETKRGREELENIGYIVNNKNNNKSDEDRGLHCALLK